MNFRKEDRVRARLRERGTHPGLICIFSALERCCTYQPWHDKKAGPWPEPRDECANSRPRTFYKADPRCTYFR